MVPLGDITPGRCALDIELHVVWACISQSGRRRDACSVLAAWNECLAHPELCWQQLQRGLRRAQTPRHPRGCPCQAGPLPQAWTSMPRAWGPRCPPMCAAQVQTRECPASRTARPSGCPIPQASHPAGWPMGSLPPTHAAHTHSLARRVCRAHGQPELARPPRGVEAWAPGPMSGHEGGTPHIQGIVGRADCRHPRGADRHTSRAPCAGTLARGPPPDCLPPKRFARRAA